MFSTSFPGSSPTRPISRSGGRVGREKEDDVNTLCDKLATDHSVCTGRATSCTHMSLRQIASCVLETFCKNLCLCSKILSLQQVAKKKIVRLVAATKFCCSHKDFHKRSPVHTKRFVAAKSRRDMLLQLLSRSVYRPLGFYRNIS